MYIYIYLCLYLHLSLYSYLYRLYLYLSIENGLHCHWVGFQAPSHPWSNETIVHLTYLPHVSRVHVMEYMHLENNIQPRTLHVTIGVSNSFGAEALLPPQSHPCTFFYLSSNLHTFQYIYGCFFTLLSYPKICYKWSSACICIRKIIVVCMYMLYP